MKEPHIVGTSHPGSRGHPVIRILMSASTVRTGKKQMKFRSLALAAEELRGTPIDGARFIREGGGQFQSAQVAALEWLEQTPSAKDWVMSDKFLLAPFSWPDGVADRFIRTPLPYEVAYVTAKGNFSMAIVFCYCYGMTLSFMSELLELPKDYLIGVMCEGIDNFQKNPSFKLWCLHLDWRKVVLPRNMAEGILERLKIRGELIVSPLDVDPTKTRILVDSPRFMSYALTVAPQKPGFRPRALSWKDVYYVRMPRGEEEGDDEEGSWLFDTSA